MAARMTFEFRRLAGPVGLAAALAWLGCGSIAPLHAQESEEAGFEEAALDDETDAAAAEAEAEPADAEAEGLPDETADDLSAAEDADSMNDDVAELAAVDEFYDDGSTFEDEFIEEDWAPELEPDVSEEALPTDRSIDPTGLGWEVVPVTSAPGATVRSRRGDYAGPAQIYELRPRRAGAAPASTRRGEDEPDVAYSFGGQSVKADEIPWQAQLYRSLAKEVAGVPRWKAQHNCGGALVAPGWILTAAHCIDDILANLEAGWRVRLGGTDLSKEDGVTYKVERWVRHSGYRNVGHPKRPNPPTPRPNMYSNDIGLVHFVADAQTRAPADPQRVQPIPLYRDAVRGGETVTAIGWGMTQSAERSFSATPVKVDLSVMDTPMCQARPGYGPQRVDGTVICAAREGKKTCRGDSGGPVVRTQGGVSQLVGLVSWGKGECNGDGLPSVFTRVQSHLPWIDQAMKLPPTRTALP